MRVVQIVSSGRRRVGLVDEDRLRLLDGGSGPNVYSLAMRAAEQGQELRTAIEDVVGSESVDYHAIYEGRKNMSYSAANLEHHHLEYDAHRRPGCAHIHFFGADAFSFGDGVSLEPGDVMEVSSRGLEEPCATRSASAKRQKR